METKKLKKLKELTPYDIKMDQELWVLADGPPEVYAALPQWKKDEYCAWRDRDKEEDDDEGGVVQQVTPSEEHKDDVVEWLMEMSFERPEVLYGELERRDRYEEYDLGWNEVNSEGCFVKPDGYEHDAFIDLIEAYDGSIVRLTEQEQEDSDLDDACDEANEKLKEHPKFVPLFQCESEILGSQAVYDINHHPMLIGGFRGRRRGVRRKPGRKPFVRPPPRNMTVPPRETAVLRVVFNDVVNNASLVLPYGYAYVNLTNPLKSNGGAATIVPFWTEQQGRQRKYRVFSTRVQVSAVNQEAFGVDFGIVAMNSLLTQTIVNCRSSLSNKRCKKKLMSGVGSPNRCDLVSAQSIKQFAGFYTRGAEDNYVGLTDGSADPTDNIYLMIIADTNGVASVSGILVSVAVTFVIDFMEPQNAIN